MRFILKQAEQYPARLAAGQPPEGLRFQYVRGQTQAYDGDKLIGYLRPSGGKIDMIKVLPEYRRRGVATSMLNWHRENIDPDIAHSTDQTPLGRAWGKSVGWAPTRWTRQDPERDEPDFPDYEAR